MQSLYAFFSLKEDRDIAKAEKAMLKQFDEIVELHIVIISLLVALVRYTDDFLEAGKKKHLAQEKDLNPNKRFVDNSAIQMLRADETLMKKVAKVARIWTKDDYDLVRKIFKNIYTSDLYAAYLINPEQTDEVDKKFIVDVLKGYILNNKLFHHILEEKSIFWSDDLPFVATLVIAQIREIEPNNNSFFLQDVFKNKADKNFALDLFRKSIMHNKEFEEVIVQKAKNWDLDRIAIMDQLLIKMALCEILYMEELPIKVSMNEYIEIAKYYSTSKSKVFVNGLLDNAVKQFTKAGKIKKTGRGLIN